MGCSPVNPMTIKCPDCQEKIEPKLISDNILECPACTWRWINKDNLPIKTYSPITTEAWKIINGDRRTDYGDAKESFQRIASFWSIILNHPVTAEQVAQCMITFKLAREMANHKKDNLVDICGYSELLNILYEK